MFIAMRCPPNFPQADATTFEAKPCYVTVFEPNHSGYNSTKVSVSDSDVRGILRLRLRTRGTTTHHQVRRSAGAGVGRQECDSWESYVPERNRRARCVPRQAEQERPISYSCHRSRK